MRSSPWSVLLLVLPMAALARSIDVGFPSEGRASRPFEELAGLAPHAETDTYGVARRTFDRFEDRGYIIDWHYVPGSPGLLRRPPTRDSSELGDDGTWLQVWRPPFRPTLVLDGVPQAAWRAPSVHELMP
ncbi:hypothetical protein ACLESO_44925 [Pyxidicoccus sp. 3LG]